MPILDMPLHELKNFKGLNERPADIDAYWDKAIAEMEALGTDCELIPPNSRCPTPNALICGSPAWAARACTASICAPPAAKARCPRC